MKNSTRWLSAVLSLMMIITCMVVPAFAADTQTDNAAKTAFSDVPESAIYSDAVVTLNLMKVLNGYEDGTFKPDQNVTRAEFTAMLMRTLNYGSLGETTAANLPFSDVDDNNSDINWAIPNINTAYGMGIINGYEDGTFRPSDNVAYEEAIKMIVCTLGYGKDIDISVTPWYTNFVGQAARLGITEHTGTLGAAETPASRACIAQMLFDSLDVKLVEQEKVTEKTILTDYLGYIKNTGVIASDGVTSLTSPDVNLRDNEIQIYAKEPSSNIYETHTYSTSDTSFKQYLGYQVEYYYSNKSGDVRTLALCILKNNSEITLNARDIEEAQSSDTQIKYYKNANDRNTTNLNLDSQNIVIYNNKLYGSNENQSRFSLNMLPDVGSITLIDAGGDGKYDYVKIMDYQVYYVSGKTASDYSIVDNLTRTGDNKSLTLDVDVSSPETRIVNTSGATVSYSSIATGNVICLAESNNNGGNVIRTAVVVTEAPSGTVSGRESGETITVGSKTYRYSKAAPWMNGNSTLLEEPSTQDSVKLALDINGDVVAYVKNSSSDSTPVYGYIEGYSTGDSIFSDEVSLRIINASGKVNDYSVTKNTKINGKSVNSPSAALDILEESAKSGIHNNDEGMANLSVQQVVKYNVKGYELNNIYTAEAIAAGKEVVSDSLTVLTSVNAQSAMTYNSGSKQLSSGGINVNIGSATVFLVPHNRTDYSKYKKGSLASNFRNGKEHNVEVFDVSNANAAKVVVLYGVDATTDVDEGSPLYVMNEKISEKNNPEESANMYTAKGYKASSSSPKGEFEEWMSNESDRSVSSLGVGDIFRAGTDSDGYTKFQEKNIVYRPSDSNNTSYYGRFLDLEGNNQDAYDAEFALILGSVIATDDSIITLVPEKLDKGMESTQAVQTFNISDLSGARVLKYRNTANGELTLVDVSSDYTTEVKGLTGYDQTDQALDPTEVLVYMYKGKVKLFCILTPQN